MNDPLLGSFVWCELLTTDTDAAGKFYRKIIGWKTAPWPGESSYTTFMAAAGSVAGMMLLPDDAKRMGAPPNWMIYVGTPDVDVTAGKIAQLGGRVLRQPESIPSAGRFAVVADPQGAVFGIYTPLQAAPSGPPARGFSWYELYSPKPESAWSFYHALFGWEKTSAMDMGAMGVYQMFGRGGGVPNGGIMKPPPGAPAAWMPYISVGDAKAVAALATRLGAKIINGPMEVPGGDWIAVGMDPQGAMFAVHSPKPAAAVKPAVAKKSAPKKAATKKAAPRKKAPARKPAAMGKARTKASRPIAKASKRKAPKKAAKRAVRKAKKR